MNNDWTLSFVPAVRQWLAGHNPYATPLPFASPPWSLMILTPLAWLPPVLAILFPALALLYCAYRVRKPYLIPIVGLSFPFIAASIYANIDWMVMVGVVIGGPLGVILNTVKPQAGVFANLALLAKCDTWPDRARLLLPLLVLALVTLPLYGAWFAGMQTISTDTGAGRNFSLFPYSIPVGVVGLVLAWRQHSVFWGVVASLCLAPYFYIHSLMPLLFLIANRDWRGGIAVNVALWGLVLLIVLGTIPLDL